VIIAHFDVADREMMYSLDLCGTLDQAKVPRAFAANEARQACVLGIPTELFKFKDPSIVEYYNTNPNPLHFENQ